MRIIADLHTHTRYSHGRGSVVENVAAALGRGLLAVGITDHGPRSAPWIGASVADFAAMQREVREVNRRAPDIRVLAGAECNIVSVDGALDLPHEVRSQLDIVLAGLHPGVRHASGRDWFLLSANNWGARFSPAMRRKARLINTQAAVEAVHRNVIDVFTHPGYHLDIDTAELARACAQQGTALEINARHQEMTTAFVRVAARQGVRFVINSDAHRPSDVGSLEAGLAVARMAGLEPEQVLNSDQGRLFEWLAARRQRRQATGRGGWADWAERDLPGDGAGPERPESRQRSYWADWAEQGGKVH